MKTEFFPNLNPLVMTLTATALAVSSCGKSAPEATMTEADFQQIFEDERTKLNEQITSLRNEKETLQDNVAVLDQEIKSLREDLLATGPVIQEKEELTGQLEIARAQAADFRLRYRTLLWDSAIDTDLGELTTVDGKTYEDAKIKGLTDEGIEIMHSSGIGKISPELLPVELQTKYLFAEGAPAISEPAPPLSDSPSTSISSTPPLPSDEKVAKITELEKTLVAETDKLTEMEAGYISIKEGIIPEGQMKGMNIHSELKAVDGQLRSLEQQKSNAERGIGGTRMSSADIAKKYQRPIDSLRAKEQQLENARSALRVKEKGLLYDISAQKKKIKELKNDIYRTKYY
ncbi:MAG: hypothetical protein AAGD22_01320 [Verrucomicrobiota bacterium]